MDALHLAVSICLCDSCMTQTESSQNNFIFSNVSNNWQIFSNSWLYLKKFISNAIIHEVCNLFKIYLLINGLKLVNGIIKEVGSNKSDVFAFLIHYLIPRDTYMTRNPTEKNFFICLKLVTFSKSF